MDPSMPEDSAQVDTPGPSPDETDLDQPVGQAMTLRDLAPSARDGYLHVIAESEQ